MTIELQTGLPGNGKTLYTLDRIESIRKRTGRPVFYSGIPIYHEKLPDWQELPDPKKWFDVPPMSIVIIDEAQSIFRPRPSGSAVPEYEARLEKHRHGGIDLVLLTQNPKLISTNVRELVGKHYHIVRQFGLQRATVHEWQECKTNTQQRRDSIKHLYSYRKEVYSWYKSAEAHTVKASVPMKVWILGALIVAIPAGGFFIWRHLAAMSYSTQPKVAPSMLGGPSSAPQVGQPREGRRVVTQAEYLDQYRPRVPGLHYTAPAYDEVTKPVHAPYPAACLRVKNKCGCYSQQGTRLDVPADLCSSIVDGGFFVAWDANKQENRAVPGPAPTSDRLSGGFGDPPEAHNLTPGYTPKPRMVATVSQEKQQQDTGQGRGKLFPKP